MTLNEIKSKCPTCGCTRADVLCITTIENKNKVVVKCISKEKPHQYTLELNGKNTEWKQFFKEET